MATQQQVTFSHYDTAEYLQTEEEIAAYLETVMEENDPSLLAAALGDVARARNMSKLAKDVGMSREGLYKALSGEPDSVKPAPTLPLSPPASIF